MVFIFAEHFQTGAAALVICHTSAPITTRGERSGQFTHTMLGGTRSGSQKPRGVRKVDERSVPRIRTTDTHVIAY